MDMLQWKRNVIENPVKKAMPILSYPAVQIMGSRVGELIRDSGLMALGMKRMADRVPSLASVSMMDLTVECECFGTPAEYFEDMIPCITGTVVHSAEDAKALRIPEIGEGRTGICIDAVSRAKKMITDRPVFASMIGPYALAGRLLGMSEFMTACVTDPGMVTDTLEKTTEFLIRYAKAFRMAGADGIIIAEPTVGLISPKMARRLAHPYSKKVIDAVREEDFLVFYHNCGESVAKMAQDLADLHADGYNFGSGTRLAEIIPCMPQDSLILGNVDPTICFCAETPEKIRVRTREILNSCSEFPNFVIASSCDVPADCSWDCIDAFFGEVSAFYSGI